MQMTIYYTEDDQYLIDKIEQEADAHRKSKSAVILTALEYYLERNLRVGEILCDMGRLQPKQLQKALDLQKKQNGRMLGEILLAEEMVRNQDLNRALAIQGRITPQ